jgi:quercetin dioxygenase-like cupin family protein/uncharacterized membrane protein
MAGKINFLGHPVHPMVIVFPLGLLPAAVACDIIDLVRGGGQWAHIAYWLIAAGVVSGLVAAGFGFTDWLALDNGTRAKRIGLWHAFVMDTVIILFAVSWWLRRSSPDAPTTLEIGLGIAAAGFALIGGWLGGGGRSHDTQRSAARPKTTKPLTEKNFTMKRILTSRPVGRSRFTYPLVVWVIIVGTIGLGSATAADDNAKITLVYEHALPNVPGKSIKGVLVEYGPGGSSPAHTHPKSAFIYATVLEGAIQSAVNDGPVVTYRKGESFSEMPGDRHSVSENASKTEPAKLLAVFVVNTNEKELTTPIKK